LLAVLIDHPADAHALHDIRADADDFHVLTAFHVRANRFC